MWARRAILAVAAHPAVARAVARHGVRAAARFVAGEELEDALRAVRELNAAGLKATVDYLGEAVTAPEAARAAAGVYAAVLDRLAAERLDANISLKPTQLGLALDPALCRSLVGGLVERAAAAGNFVRLDMEDSRYTQATLDLFRELRRARESVGVVLQAYLYRSADDLRSLHRFAAELPRPVLNVRFCKGAYSEPPSVAYPRRREVDANFLRLVIMHLEAGHYAAVATHDERLIEEVIAYLGRRGGAAAGRCEFQMLYGIRRDLQRALAARGFPVRVYVPFGRDWYAYFVRRLAERPANVAFLVRSLLREGRAGRGAPRR